MKIVEIYFELSQDNAKLLRLFLFLKIIEIYFEPRQDDDELPKQDDYELPKLFYFEDIDLDNTANDLIFLHITKKR